MAALAPRPRGAVVLLAALLAAWGRPAAGLRRLLNASAWSSSTAGRLRLEVDGNAASLAEEAGNQTEGSFSMGNIGPYSGLLVRSDFAQAAFWDRGCRQHQIRHTQGDTHVFSALYNDCAGVSDVIYYTEDTAKFCSGCGRGGSWRDDPQLNQIYRGLGLPTSAHARAGDYDGVGFFSIDRGHQAPVGSLNRNDDMATLTNVPTNLSPQTAVLNRNNWLFLESDMRSRATSEGAALDMLTGPLYELPEAFFRNARGRALWEQVLQSGGGVLGASAAPWCSERDGPGFRSRPLAGRDEAVRCQATGSGTLSRAAESPNRLQIRYQRAATRKALRAPLGYYKVMVSEHGRSGRRVCAWVMDQVGQCLVVSLPLLSQLAGLAFSGADFARRGVPQLVDADWCLLPGARLARGAFCERRTAAATSAGAITVALMDEYWRGREAAR